MAAWDFLHQLIGPVSDADFRAAVNQEIKADGDSTEDLTKLLRRRRSPSEILRSRTTNMLAPIQVMPPGVACYQDGPEISPLLLAAALHKPARVRVLLDCGMSPMDSTPDGRTALHLAVVGYPELSMLSVHQMQWHQKTGRAEVPPDACPSVDAAARQASIATIRVLLYAGADPNAKNAWGSPPIRIAAGHDGMTEQIALLIDNGAEIDARAAAGLTALMIAAASGNLHVLRLLLARGANHDLEDNAGRTALLGAAMNKQTNALRELLSAGANPNRSDKQHISPLHYACARGDEVMVRLLLEAGAEVNASDCYGNTPMDAIGDEQKDHIETLISAVGGRPCARREPPLEPLTYYPVVQGAKSAWSTPMGRFRLHRLSDFVSVGQVKYTHLMAAVNTETGIPCLYVAAERNASGPAEGPGSHFLGVFDQDGHKNYGADEDWGRFEQFEGAAIRLVRSYLEL